MAKITWKPGTMLAPVPPALISCGSIEKPNVMTVAWTGIISSDPVMTYVSIRPSRYSHEIIKENGEFVINLTTLDLVTAADYCGVKSGRDIDKFKEMNLTAAACSEVKAPQIVESPVSIECKVKSITNYGTHDMFLAEVVAVNVDDKYIDKSGKLVLDKAGLVAFAHAHYYTLGRNLGSFGFSVNKSRLKVMQKMQTVEVEVKEPKVIVEKAAKKFEKKKWGGNRPQNSRNNEDRPRRNFDDKPREKRNFDERPRRSFGDKPRNDGEGRAPRSFDDKPRERRNFDERPRRSFGDKPRNDGEGRAPRSFDDKQGEHKNYSGKPGKFDGKAKFAKTRGNNDYKPGSTRKSYTKTKKS